MELALTLCKKEILQYKNSAIKIRERPYSIKLEFS